MGCFSVGHQENTRIGPVTHVIFDQSDYRKISYFSMIAFLGKDTVHVFQLEVSVCL